MIILMGPTSFTFSNIEHFLCIITKTNKKSYVNIPWNLNLELWVTEFWCYLPGPLPDASLLALLPVSSRSSFKHCPELESHFYYLFSLIIFPEQENLDVTPTQCTYMALDSTNNINQFMNFLHEGKDFHQFCSVYIYNQSLGHWHTLDVQ